MKLATVEYQNEEIIGAINNNKFFSLKKYFKEKNMNDLIINHSLNELLKIEAELYKDEGIPLNMVTLLSPIPKPRADVLCLGLNYMKHIKEASGFDDDFQKPKEPIYFSKRTSKTIGTNSFIDPHFDLTNSLDYEAELGVIIGKDAYKVKKENYKNYIFGYTIINDISARDLQISHKEWHYGKSLDTYCPMGPYIVTSDEIDDTKLNVKSYVNGELRQNGFTSDFIFNVAYIIEDLTKGIILEAGTIISTGTPDGVGMGFKPPKFLKSKDVVKCEISGIGELINFIK